MEYYLVRSQTKVPILSAYEDMRTATGQDCAGYDCLKNYIDRAEAAYSWTDLGTTLEVPDLGGGGGGWTGFVLNMTSQTWMSPDLGQWESHLIATSILHLQ